MRNNHIGEYIKNTVIPQGVTVKDAAGLLGVGRPALSNLLNGRASLSIRMAQKLEATFSADANELLEMQSKSQANTTEIDRSDTKVYVPRFMEFTANDIEAWINTKQLNSRARLAVFLRTLVNSTCRNLLFSDFPGNDDSQRHGWDGETLTESPNPWVPNGKTGWEFGTNNDKNGGIQRKAKGDYEKSLTDPERKKTTFVFVTPRRWNGKKDWATTRTAENNFKEVRAYDSSDLEQWMEQSIPAQIWFSIETGTQTQGCLTLEEHWNFWKADTSPHLTHSIFAENLGCRLKQNVKTKIDNKQNVVIAADSIDEGIAYLDALFLERELNQYRDRVIVFKDLTAIPKVMSGSANIIPVIVSKEGEREFAKHDDNVSAIMVRNKNIFHHTDPDITLSIVGLETFRTSLKEMGYDDEEIRVLAADSGRSPTILRRRLSSLDGVRSPKWINDIGDTSFIISAALAGAWDTRNGHDKEVVAAICDESYAALEKTIQHTLEVDESPLWREDTHLGVISKMDILFSLSENITPSIIENFLVALEYVLSESDPTLDLPEEDRIYAGIYGIHREISGILRRSIAETMVLLSVYSEELIGRRLGLDVSQKIAKIVLRLLSPLNIRTLFDQSYMLTFYAETSPEEFLTIVEDDLNSKEPCIPKFFVPASQNDPFSNPSGIELLWALEIIAWFPEHFDRVILLLAKLHKLNLTTGTAHHPFASLFGVFRSRSPQTYTSFNERLSTFLLLKKEHPDICWDICIEKINGTNIIAINNEPIYRHIAHGSPQLSDNKEREELETLVYSTLLGWKDYSLPKLIQLVECAHSFRNTSYIDQLWGNIEEWCVNANDEDKAILREQVRQNLLINGVQAKLEYELGSSYSDHKSAAIKTYELLKPENLINRHRWLFDSYHVELSIGEAQSDPLDYEERDEQIKALRLTALSTIYKNIGIDGVHRLTREALEPYQVGFFAYDALSTDSKRIEFIKLITSSPEALDSQALAAITGMFDNSIFSDAGRGLLEGVKFELRKEEFLKTLPFNKVVWRFLEGQSEELSNNYWRNTGVRYYSETEDTPFVFEQLLNVDRPCAALAFIGTKVNRISPELLYRAMDEATSSIEPEGALGQFQPERSIKELAASGEYSIVQLAEMEYRYLRLLDPLYPEIDNIEELVNTSPEYFAKLVSNTNPRDEEVDEQLKERYLAQIQQNIRVLMCLKKVPGRIDNVLNADELTKWIRNVLIYSEKLDCRPNVEYHIGELLANSGVGTDKIWPNEEVREALENELTEKMQRGFIIGRRNLRGIRFGRGNGDKERTIAQQFSEWSIAIASSHPKVSRILNELAVDYISDGQKEDHDVAILNRLNTR